MAQEYFKPLRPGDRVSRSEYNRITQSVVQTLMSRLNFGMRSPQGLFTRQPPAVTTETETTDLVGWWPLTSADGDEDTSGQNNDGTFVGNANTDYDILQLDGTGDWLNLDAHAADYANMMAGTVAAWIYATSNSKMFFTITYGAGDGQTGAFMMHLGATGKIGVEVSGAGYTMRLTTTATLAKYRWHHVAYVSDSTGNAVYVDGQLQAVAYTVGSSATQAFFAADGTGKPLDAMRIGVVRVVSTDVYPWRGGISDVRIYNRAQPQADIINIYEQRNHNFLHADGVVGACRVFEVQSNATGDGVYNCYAQTLDETEWDDTAGDPKFDDFNTTNVEVLNLAESNPEATYVRHLAANDLLLGFRHWDDEGNIVWVGVPFRLDDGNRCRIAYVTSAPGATDNFSAELDYKDSGTSITVYGLIAQGGTALNAAIPRLAADDPVMVRKCRYYDGTSTRDRWVCTTVFQPSIDCTCET